MSAERPPDARRRDSARLVAALGLALSFRPTLVRRTARDQAMVSGTAAVFGAVAGTGTEIMVGALARRMGGHENVARGVVIGAGAVAILAQLPAHRRSSVALAGSVARVSGISAIVGSVAPMQRDDDPLHDPRAVAAAGAVGMAAFVGWKQLMKRSRPRRTRMTEWPDAEYLPTVSIGPDSLIPQETLDFEASRFLAGTEKGLPIDPIRVFVGVHSAPTVEARAALAVRELERLGAFDRRRIVVISATLRGYVNPIIPDAIEQFSGGDCACVVIQYYDKRTMLMPAKVPIAARTHRELLRRLVRHPKRAEVAVYGESLGAWASQNVFRTGGTAALDALGVERALWIGTPYFSLLRRDFERGKLPVDERVATIRATDLVDDEPEDAGKLRFVFLHRMTDPVVLFPGLELFWRRPEWMPSSEWRPGITFVQTLIDLVNATNWTSALPQAMAHDYRLEGPLGVRLAFGHHDVSREDAARIADELIAQEVANGAHLRAARRRYTAPR
ncbi:MAG TPA: alpha/beta-hydrolase family protein [Solirubrobacteraceae bacterium]|nr:alpha/beta-hydrolase family protein [Solirubrobacteraceae bacterium]